METQFDKPSVVRQPNAQRIPKPSVLGKPTPFSNSPEMRSFQTKQTVNKTNVSDGLFKQATQQNLPQIRKQVVRNTNVITPGPSRNNPKHVSFQSPKEFVGSNDMVHNYYLEKAKKSAQLQKDKDVNGKPSMIDPARLPNTANGCKPKPRNWQASMSSRVSNKDVYLGEHRKQNPFLKFNDLQCPTCKKCLYTANHDECVLEYLSKLNPRASAQNKDAKSHNTTKRYVPVEKTSESKKLERLIPKGHRILKTVCLWWVPTGKLLNSCTGKVENEPTHGSNVDIPHIHACKQTLGLSAGTSFNGQKQQRIDLNTDALYNAKQENLRVWPCSSMFKKMFDQRSSSLVLHQMTSDHNRPELGIQDHNNEPSSSKLVPKVVPLAVKTATSRQELELLFHHHIAMLRTTDFQDKCSQSRGINPMIQPEPEDLPKDNPMLEIAVLRLKKCILNGPYVPTSVLIQAVPEAEGRPAVQQHTAIETVLNMTPENKEHFQSEKEAIFLLLTGIGDEIYSTVDACNTANEMWIAIERLQQGESLNVQDVKTNLFWEFGKFTSRDGESMESYYSRFYKLMNELTRNNLQVTTMQVNV
ncbi:hypothetical protein Tco_0382947 [Tanacetum coccineum]